MINIAHLIIGQSLERKENKGGYFNSDNVKHCEVVSKRSIDN